MTIMSRMLTHGTSSFIGASPNFLPPGLGLLLGSQARAEQIARQFEKAARGARKSNRKPRLSNSTLSRQQNVAKPRSSVREVEMMRAQIEILSI